VTVQKEVMGVNKLWLYRDLNPTLNGADYVHYYMNRHERRILFQFRAGCAPIQLELGRYGRNGYVPPTEWLCPVCESEMEDETHVLIRCPLYIMIRSELFSTVLQSDNSFINLSDREKVVYLLSEPHIAKDTARACSQILQQRHICPFICGFFFPLLNSH
jgi:hypothetical protein